MARGHHGRGLESVGSRIVIGRLYGVAETIRSAPGRGARNPGRRSKRIAAAPIADYQAAVRSIGNGSGAAACVITCGIFNATVNVRTAVRFVGDRLGSARASWRRRRTDRSKGVAKRIGSVNPVAAGTHVNA